MKHLITLAVLLWVPLVVAQDPSEAKFRDLENQIWKAVMAGDTGSMEKLFAKDYVSVGVSGRIRSKLEIIKMYTGGDLKITSVQTGEITVRQYGDIAIVVGTITVEGTELDLDISGSYAFTRVYNLGAGEWKAVSFQATLASTKFLSGGVGIFPESMGAVDTALNHQTYFPS